MKASHTTGARPATARRLLSTMIVAALGAAGSSAHAVEFDTGHPDLVVRWDNTLRVNLANRVEGEDASLLASPNFDDGDRNFGRGMVSERVDLLSEFDLVWQDRLGCRWGRRRSSRSRAAAA